jgi:hypothetical protein
VQTLTPIYSSCEIQGQAYRRVLHLIDVENIVGSASFSRELAGAARLAYDDAAPAGAVNIIVIATSHHAAPEAWFAWPETARRLVRSGRDGADLALIDVISMERIAQRFDQVVIGSGDRIFAFPAARIQAAGCPVTVVTRRESLSRELRLAVRDVRYLELPRIAVSRTGVAA